MKAPAPPPSTPEREMGIILVCALRQPHGIKEPLPEGRMRANICKHASSVRIRNTNLIVSIEMSQYSKSLLPLFMWCLINLLRAVFKHSGAVEI